MPPPAGGQPDNSAGILWGIAAIFAAIGIVWYAFRNYIVAFYLTIKLYEVDFLNAIMGDRYLIVANQLTDSLTRVSMLTFHDVVLLGGNASTFLKYPFAFLLIVLAVVLYFSNSARSYRRTYDMLFLARLEKQNWPQITPTVDLELL